MKPIGLNEIQNLRHAVQYFQDCYLVSAIGTLTQTSNGRKILSENIAKTADGYRIRFNNVKGSNKDFFVTEKEMNNLVYMDKFLNPIPLKPGYPHNPIIKAIEVAMNKLLTKYPSQKPFICRIPKCNEKFEFNKPSNFLEMFTGKKAIKLNENGLKLNLKSQKDASIELLEKIKANPENSFVAGTAFCFHKKLIDNHCYSINRVKDNRLEIFDHRSLETITLTYEEAIKKLKFIVGYFNKDLI